MPLVEPECSVPVLMAWEAGTPPSETSLKIASQSDLRYRDTFQGRFDGPLRGPITGCSGGTCTSLQQDMLAAWHVPALRRLGMARGRSGSCSEWIDLKSGS